MNCLDCQTTSTDIAVGICSQCGAAVCAKHAVIKSERLSCTGVMGRVVAIEPPVRRLLCTTCAQAHHEHAKCCPQTAGTLAAS